MHIIINENKIGPFEWNKKFNEFDLESYTILLTLGGSRSYGTETPTSDWDYKGICIQPEEYRKDLFKTFEQTIWKSEEKSLRESEIVKDKEALFECTIFELKKFFLLAKDCNPNVLEILFTRDEDLLKIDYWGNLLRQNRDIFLSNRLLYSFTGYAISQLKRIEHHRSYLFDKPDHMPTREEYGLNSYDKNLNESEIQACLKLLKDKLEEISPWLCETQEQDKERFFYSVAAMVSILNKQEFKFDIELNNPTLIAEDISFKVSKHLGFDTSFIEYLKREKQYYNACRAYKQYKQWESNRNLDRHKLEIDNGYDTKHAMHLVRLLLMADELLKTGNLNVYRSDREYLLDIRNGKYSYDYIINFAKSKEKELYQIVKEGKSTLPPKPNLDKINKLYCEIIE